MQHSSLMRFCPECGLANDPTAIYCVACQHPFTHASSITGTLNAPVAPITIIPPPALEVTPGLLSSLDKKNTADELQRGSLLARRYRIQEEIGQGGFSVVYRAVDLKAGRRLVAIKRIQLSMLTPRQALLPLIPSIAR